MKLKKKEKWIAIAFSVFYLVSTLFILQLCFIDDYKNKMHHFST
jgi:hypothetical protein